MHGSNALIEIELDDLDFVVARQIAFGLQAHDGLAATTRTTGGVFERPRDDVLTVDERTLRIRAEEEDLVVIAVGDELLSL